MGCPIIFSYLILTSQFKLQRLSYSFFHDVVLTLPVRRPTLGRQILTSEVDWFQRLNG